MTTPALCSDATGFVAAATSPAATATGEEAGVFATLLEELQPALEAALGLPLPAAEAPLLDGTVPPEAVLQGVPLPTLLPLHVPLPADAAPAETAAAVPAVAGAPLAVAPVLAAATAAAGAPAPTGTAPVPGAPAAEPPADLVAAAPAAVVSAAAAPDQTTATTGATGATGAAVPATGPIAGTSGSVTDPDPATSLEAAPEGTAEAPAPGAAAADLEPAPSAPAPSAPAAVAAQPEAVGPQAEQVTAQAASAAGGPAGTEAPAPAAEASVRAVQPAVAELARGLKSATPGHASLVVRLDPPELGAVLVRVQVRGGEVSVSCTTPDIGAVHALAFQKADVMELLRNEGLDLASFEVRQPSTSMDGRREQGEAQTGEAMQRERERGREGSRPDTAADEQGTTPDDVASRDTWL